MEKALIVIIFMYAVSTSLLVGQYVLGDVFGITITNFTNDPVKSSLLPLINQAHLGAGQTNATGTTLNTVQSNPLVTAASQGYQLFVLFSGTFIFNLLYFFGVPAILVGVFQVLYFLFAIRAMVGLIKEFI